MARLSLVATFITITGKPPRATLATFSYGDAGTGDALVLMDYGLPFSFSRCFSRVREQYAEYDTSCLVIEQRSD